MRPVSAVLFTAYAASVVVGFGFGGAHQDVARGMKVERKALEKRQGCAPGSSPPRTITLTQTVTRTIDGPAPTTGPGSPGDGQGPTTLTLTLPGNGQVITVTEMAPLIQTVVQGGNQGGGFVTVTETQDAPSVVTVQAPGAPGGVVTITLPAAMPNPTGSVQTITLPAPGGGQPPQVVTVTAPASRPTGSPSTGSSSGTCPAPPTTGCGNGDSSQSSSEAKTIVAAFDTVTGLSASLTEVVKTLSIGNAFSVIIQIVPAFTKIVSTLTADVSALSAPGMVPVGCGDADAIVVALADFVEVHQNLLGVVIGKRGLLNSVPGLSVFVLPINAVLVLLEGVVDSVAGVVIGFIPSRSCEANLKIAALKGSVQAAEKAFT